MSNAKWNEWMNDAGLWASFIMYSSQPQSFTLFSFHPVEENSQHWFLTMSYFLENHMQQMLNAPVCSCRKLMTNTALFCGKSSHMAQKDQINPETRLLFVLIWPPVISRCTCPFLQHAELLLNSIFQFQARLSLYFKIYIYSRVFTLLLCQL